MVVNNEQIRFQKKDKQKKELELRFTHASDFEIGAGAKQLTVRFDREKWRQIQGHKSA